MSFELILIILTGRDLQIYRCGMKSCFVIWSSIGAPVFFQHTFYCPPYFGIPRKTPHQVTTFYVIQLYTIRFFCSPTLNFCRSYCLPPGDNQPKHAAIYHCFINLSESSPDVHKWIHWHHILVGYNSYVYDENIYVTSLFLKFTLDAWPKATAAANSYRK